MRVHNFTTACRVAAFMLLSNAGTASVRAETQGVAAAAPTASCAAEWTKMADVHPAVRAALGKYSKAQIDRAAVAHGRAVLAWQADLIDQFLQVDPARIHPVRKRFLTASSTYLRCRHAAMTAIPDWRPNRTYAALPAAMAIPGDLLFTDEQCAVFLRGEVAGIPGTGGDADRMAWRWNGACTNGRASGVGRGELVLRSGEVRAGLLNNGFAAVTLLNGSLSGMLRVTDDSRTEAGWRNHFDQYVNGRVKARYRQGADKSFQRIEYRKMDGDWVWTPVPKL